MCPRIRSLKMIKYFTVFLFVLSVLSITNDCLEAGCKSESHYGYQKGRGI